MQSYIIRPLVGQMKAAADAVTGKVNDRTLVTHATAARHSFLGHGLVHGTSDRRSYHHHEAERSTFASLQQQLSQSQSSSSDSLASNKLGLSARKPYEWMNDSHTRTANSLLAAYGCYRVVGPARISKRGDTLVAYLFRGSRVEVLGRDGNTMPYGSMESISEEVDLTAALSEGCSTSYSADDEECVAECVLVAAHVELSGSACSVDLIDLSVQPAVHHRNGHTYVSVRSLPPEAVIKLDADSDLRHPINITPVSSPAA